MYDYIMAKLAKLGVHKVDNYLRIPKNSLGIKSWGMIDFLINHVENSPIDFYVVV